MIARVIFAILCGLALSGCQNTTVESLPAGATRECPQEWAGAWIGEDDLRRDEADGGMYVDSTCVPGVVMRDAQKSARNTDIHPSFFDAAGGRYVLMPHAEVIKLLELHSDDAAPIPQDFVALRWSVQEQELVLVAADHRRVATWIVQGALNGYTSCHSDGDCLSIIHGDADAIARVLRDHGSQLFDGDEKAIRLRRVGANRAALDAAVAKADKEAKKRDAAARARS